MSAAAALDKTRGALVCLADADRENPKYPGEWFSIPEEWVQKLAADIKQRWDSESTLYFLQSDSENGRKIVAIYPIADESVDISDTEHRNIAYAVAECYINDVAENILHYALKVGALIMVITLVAAIFVGLHMKRAVADPINAIANTAIAYVQDRKNGVARSDHFSSLGIQTGDELENLTDIMADMERELIGHEEYITKITAEKERISVELNMASEIQASVLPRVFPPFPWRRDFDLYASMTPAKEVGGDFCDLFLIDDDHLALVIADVSGKGIPAALFMMIAKSLIKDQLLNGCDPALALQRTNTHLLEGNT